LRMCGSFQNPRARLLFSATNDTSGTQRPFNRKEQTRMKAAQPSGGLRSQE